MLASMHDSIAPMTNPTNPGARTSVLAVVALVLAFLAPLFGLILGVVAQYKINRDPDLKGKGYANAAIGIGGVMLFLSIFVLPAVAIPAFIAYIRKAKQAEIEDRLSEIARSAEGYYVHEQINAQGEQLAPQFPMSTSVTPDRPCAESQDGRCPPDPSAWSHPTWQALRFSIPDPHYYRYQFVGRGSAFVVRAHGDLDDDGMYSTFEMSGVAAPGGQVMTSPEISEHQPTE